MKTETKATHTPGPWSTDFNQYVVSPEGLKIGQVFTMADGKRNGELARESEANARLIAAAPELLQACHRAMTHLRGHEHGQFIAEAIAKATH